MQAVVSAVSDPLVWKVDPFLFEWGPLRVRWYGMLFALGFLGGFFLMRWIFRREKKPEEDVDFLLIYVMLGTVVGARLGHVFFYQWEYYLAHPLEIVQVWQGGLASHGGFLGVLAALSLYASRRPEQSFSWLLDRLVIPAALAGSFIRMGNFFNQEILGIPASVPWAVVFARYDSVPRHPAQLYEAGAYLLIFLGLLGIYRRYGPDLSRYLLFGGYLASVFGARFLIEFVKMQQAPFAEGWVLSVGQILSLPLIALGLVLVARASLRNDMPSVRTRT